METLLHVSTVIGAFVWIVSVLLGIIIIVALIGHGFILLSKYITRRMIRRMQR